MAICAVPECGRETYYRDIHCQPHYMRVRRHGDPLAGNQSPGSRKKPCKIENCERPAGGGRGYCGKHYQRYRKTGDPLAVRLPSDSERLWSRVDKSGGPNSCWEWTGFRNRDGYGHVTVDGKQNQRAHRAIYRDFYGELSDDVVVRHTCDNPPCCNPAHLLAGTQVENMADIVERGRWPRRWTDDQLEAVRVDTRPGRVVAAEYGMSQSYVYLLRKQYRYGMHRSFTA